jgi:protein TonB
MTKITIALNPHEEATTSATPRKNPDVLRLGFKMGSIQIKVILPFILFVFAFQSCRITKEQQPQAVQEVALPPVSQVQENVSGSEHESDGEIFMIVEEMPEFPGGQEGLSEFLSQNLSYPPTAQKDSVQGTVYISFVINKNGKVANPQILRGVSPELDAECIRVIKAMPDWKAGIQRGKPVRVSYTVPMRFVL